MSVFIPEDQLPEMLTPEQSVELAYPTDLAQIAGDLLRGLPVLVECEKDLAPYLFMNLRGRLIQSQKKCLYLDGRPTQEEQGNQGFVGTMIAQLRDAVRGSVDQRVVVLPHLDLLTTGQGGLTSEAREVIPLLYENPDLVWLGFKDPSFSVPRVIENLFPRRYSLLGIPRPRLSHLVTQNESRKLGQRFNPWALYKYVSGMNAVRLRTLLSTLEGEDYPVDPRRAFDQIRQATHGQLEIPTLDLEGDIGGYDKVKKRLRAEILDILVHKDNKTNADEIKRLEELIPKGMIFWGPPGTGKTMFAKAMATAIGAAITVVSGPELKSRWVGESEENLRQIFHQARQSAPSIIVFDELDSFAAARGTYTGSGVEHSMVNQLLTEMDGFHREELVFVVGTTNFVDILDPALLRPGRFEFMLHIPHPDQDDRREILKIYDKKMDLNMSEEALDYCVKRTGDYVEGAAAGTRFSGDHINALCRSLARIRVREEIDGETDVPAVDRALTEWVDRPNITAEEEFVVATHEAGHAIVALFCEHADPIERISIIGDAGKLGFVRHQDPTNRYIVTRAKLLDQLCILMGGREAERIILNDVSIGAAGDIEHATEIARAIAEELGMGGEKVGLGRCITISQNQRQHLFSEEQLRAIDECVREHLEEARRRAAQIIEEQKTLLITLRDMLLEHKVLDAKTIANLAGDTPNSSSSEESHG